MSDAIDIDISSWTYVFTWWMIKRFKTPIIGSKFIEIRGLIYEAHIQRDLILNTVDFIIRYLFIYQT